MASSILADDHHHYEHILGLSFPFASYLHVSSSQHFVHHLPSHHITSQTHLPAHIIIRLPFGSDHMSHKSLDLYLLNNSMAGRDVKHFILTPPYTHTDTHMSAFLLTFQSFSDQVLCAWIPFPGLLNNVSFFFGGGEERRARVVINNI
jgi:hypothetical protein